VSYWFDSTGPTLRFSLPNGTYEYRISASVAGWTPNITNGSETVRGGASVPTLGVVFARASSATFYGTWLQPPLVYLIVGVAAACVIVGIIVARFRGGKPPRTTTATISKSGNQDPPTG
jgi:hypothetical protein